MSSRISSVFLISLIIFSTLGLHFNTVNAHSSITSRSSLIDTDGDGVADVNDPCPESIQNWVDKQGMTSDSF